MFYPLFLIALALTLKAGYGLFSRRFPHPADLATVSVFYYSAPLALAAHISYNYQGLIFLSPQAADPELALFSIGYVVTALVALLAGRSAATLLGRPNLIFYAELDDRTPARARVWFTALFGMLALGIAFFGVKEFIAGYATESFELRATIGNGLIFSAAELLGLTIMLPLLLGQRSGKTPLKPWIVAALIALMIVLAFRAKRLEIVTAMMPAAVVLLGARSWISTPAARLTLAAAAVFGLILVSTLRVSDTLSASNAVFYALAEGLYAGHSLPGIIDRLETGYIPYEHGIRIASAPLAFIPRFLWEGKDDLILAGNAALDGVSPLGATNLLAEVVLQGGHVAVALCFFIMGFVFERAMKFEASWDEAVHFGVIPLRFGVYVTILAIFIPHFRDGIVPAVKLFLQSFVFFLLIAGFHYKFPRDQAAAV